MKQIVEFTRDINFDTNVDEVISISLDKEVNSINNNNISGLFDLYLEYKESDVSIEPIKYSASIPFEIAIDSRYALDNVSVDIDDFYYEIDDKKIVLYINLLVDNLSYTDRAIEQEVPMHFNEEELNDKRDNVNVIDGDKEENTRDLFEEKDEEKVEVKTAPIYEMFDSYTDSYVTYNVHIVREDDTVESICTKYGVSKDDISSYNDISSIKLGDKLIIPTYNK